MSIPINVQLLDHASCGNLAGLDACLLHGADIESRDETGNTALLLACGQGHHECVARLLANRPVPASVGATNDKGATALMMACNHLECLQLVTAHRPAPDFSAATEHHHTALMMAIFQGRADCVDHLLSNGFPIDVNAQSSDGATALWYAVSIGNLQIVDALLRASADIECPDSKFGSTPLMAAAECGHVDILKRLLTNSPAAHINATNKNGDTALAIAYLNNQHECAQCLLFNDPPADAYIKNKDGKSAVDLQGVKPMRSSFAHCAIM